MYTIDKLNRIFTKEQTLIILLCRLYFNRCSREDVLRFLTLSGIDSNIILDIISEHGIRPFIYHIIVEHEIPVDENVLNRLKEFFIANQARSMELAVLGSRVQKELKEKKIQVVSFKGPAFSFRYYGNIGLRESTDIDLLADPGDIERIEAHLKEIGGIAKLSVPPAFMPYYKKHFKEIVYTVKSLSQSFSVEVHWILLNRYIGAFPGFSFVKQAIHSRMVGSLQYDVLQPEYDIIAVTSNHFVKDLSVKFKYIIDVACLLHHSGNSIDAGVISKVAKQFHCRKKMDYGFMLVEELLGIQLKGWQYEYDFNEDLFRDSLRVPAVIKNFDVISLPFLKRSLLLQDNNLQRLAFLKRCAAYFLLPTNNDIDAMKTPPAFLFILGVLRPFRLAGKQLRKSFGR